VSKQGVAIHIRVRERRATGLGVRRGLAKAGRDRRDRDRVFAVSELVVEKPERIALEGRDSRRSRRPSAAG
jgi:hypothetical protein